MTVVTILVVCLLVVGAAVAVAVPRVRTRRLRERFGPEYDRVLLGHGGKVDETERELSQRLRQVRNLSLRAPSAAEREKAEAELGSLQEMFVDDPGRAVAEADRLLTSLLDEVGYPADGRLDALSVRHGELTPAYRSARRSLDRAQAVQVGTEELRTALLAIRALAQAVLRDEPPAGRAVPAGNNREGRATDAAATRTTDPTPSAG
ncbi:hypothetical protein [Kitasatospora sp. NBC_00315]|uniref:hypothetical protein n=1 Tax=Kitasatospora sp. NBC_00315 TaxID=2975963 RepID=UPI003249F147